MNYKNINTLIILRELEQVVGGINVTELAYNCGLSRGTTIYRYLDILLKNGFIEFTRLPKERGQPVLVYRSKKAKLLNLGYLSKLYEDLNYVNGDK